jgi:hypothetical protein
MASISPTVRVVAKRAPLPDFDFHCPLASLPLALGTTLESLPTPSSYLAAPAAHREQWRRKLGERIRPRIGIAWSGSAAQRNDPNRSIELSRLEPVLELDAEFHCLQKEIRARDAHTLSQYPGMKVWSDELRDFADTAALISALDLVICVDTSVAHLAGALGKPMWVLLTYATDYRWTVDRARSPWYPAARLFRQPAIGDWDAAIEELRAALREELQRPPPA